MASIHKILSTGLVLGYASLLISQETITGPHGRVNIKSLYVEMDLRKREIVFVIWLDDSQRYKEYTDFDTAMAEYKALFADTRIPIPVPRH